MPNRSKLLASLCAAASIMATGAASASVLTQVVPVKMSVTARPGEVTTHEVEIANQGDDPVVVRVTWSDWQIDEDGTLSLASEGSTPNSLHGLVEFEPAEFSVGPHESGHVRVTLHMPADGPATRWGVLLSEVKPAALTAPVMGSRASAQLGTTFYLSRIPAQIVNAEVIGMGFKALGDSVAVSVRVRNAGERHYYVGGHVALRDTTGQAVAAGDLPNGVVLPGHTRTLQWICAASLLPGRYLATATLDTGAPELTVVEGHFSWSYLRPRTLAVEQR
jgi:P pilus assembly chaperone PapD